MLVYNETGGKYNFRRGVEVGIWIFDGYKDHPYKGQKSLVHCDRKLRVYEERARRERERKKEGESRKVGEKNTDP